MEPFRRDAEKERTSLRDKVYDLLRRRIITGEIAPGGSIDDKEIAGRLGISRTPVREAIKKLSDERLVDVVAQSGTRASRIDRHEVHQAYLIRRALEMESAGEAAKNMTVTHSQALEQIVSEQARASGQKHFVEAISFDDAFHRYIAGISNLSRLWVTIEISKAELDRCRHMIAPRPGEAQSTISQHRDIIANLMGHDPERARQAMGRHLDTAYANTIKMLDAESLA
jgi:DNA-binding GntR family transcriptional regulator